MTQAFLSYASKDVVFAELARMKLNEAGIQVWVDHNALQAGEEWQAAIDKGISSSDVFLVIITPQSCESSYVTYEWAFALGKGIKVIPLLLADSKIHPRLTTLQYLDFRNLKTAPWNKLVQEINEHSATATATGTSAYVKDMTVGQLQDLIEGAVSLATAMAKTSGQPVASEDFSQAAKSVIDVIQQGNWNKGVSPRQPKQVCILWVDDYPDNNIYERSAFEAIGYRFELAHSTDEALGMLSDRGFSAIISDMGRREGAREGLVLLDALRGKGDRTPFFIYTSSSALKNKREAMERGAKGCTNNARELFELVTQAIN
jgi:CheY-like chemotaxis protein